MFLTKFPLFFFSGSWSFFEKSYNKDNGLTHDFRSGPEARHSFEMSVSIWVVEGDKL